MHRSAPGHSAAVMSNVKGPMQSGRQMDVRRSAEKRQHTEDEAHQEAEEIKIRPGHKSPRAQHILHATCRCGARAGIRETDLVANWAAHPGPAPFNCEVKRRAADGRWPLVDLHC